MTLQEGILLGGVTIVMLGAHHHHVDAAKVKAVPTDHARNISLGACSQPWPVMSRCWHGKSIDIWDIALASRIVALFTSAHGDKIAYSESFESLS